jgi:hypothetical protein
MLKKLSGVIPKTLILLIATSGTALAQSGSALLMEDFVMLMGLAGIVCASIIVWAFMSL